MSSQHHVLEGVPGSLDAHTAIAFKRRFLRRMIFVLTGGMFLDGYILGIVGPVTAKMTAALGVSTFWEG